MESVIKAVSYVMVHVPDMVVHNGTTQTVEKSVNPGSEYLKKLPEHIRTYEEVLAYPPNQTYIGNMTPEELAAIEQPWYDKKVRADRYGKYGEIMPQDEFILLMQICDSFDLVKLQKGFAASVKEKLSCGSIINDALLSRVKEGMDDEEIVRLVKEDHAEGIYHNGVLVGAVKRAHDVDINLSAHIIFENIVSKASNVLSLLYLLKNAGMNPAEIDYVIDCSEEACGDMNQRGGGNFAKAAAEIAGLTNATGSDTRSFCAGPAHAMVIAAALVKAGVYKNVVVSAGGTTAKLGMNGKDHVKKGLPILEDVLGGFAALISTNDGVNPEINLEFIGRHTVGTGSSPQAVITSLIAAPLEKAGLKITDIDKYSPELQNPDVTKPAGAGDVPLANYKMIAALAVQKGQLERDKLAMFTKVHGMAGWAPTQGHIPSGVPYLGFACQDILDGKIKRAMIIGKGSLFLARMTNLFDGISFIIQPNSGLEKKTTEFSEDEVKKVIIKAMKEFAQNMLREQEER